MCYGDAPTKMEIYKIGDRFILFEYYGHDEEIGKSHVQINEISEHNIKECFDNPKIKKMPEWETGKIKSIIISAEDFEDTIEEGIEQALEKMWVDDLTDEEMDSIPMDLQDKIDKFVKKNLIKNIKGLDI